MTTDVQVHHSVRTNGDTRSQRSSQRRRNQHEHQTHYKTFSANFGNDLENSLSRKQSLHKKPAHANKEKKNKADRYQKMKSMCQEYDDKITERDQQIELLKDKLVSLHGYNEQFSLENEKLKSHIESLTNDLNKNQTCNGDVKSTLACETCRAFQDELVTCNDLLEKYKYDNHQLRQDTNMMKILIYRLNVQLERYQDKVRLSSKDMTSSTFDQFESHSRPDMTMKEPLKWGSVNSHTLAPLLNALSMSICEKSELIQKCEETMNAFTWKMKEIMMENEHLHGKMEDVNVLQNQLTIWKSRTEILLKKNEFMKEKLTQVLTCYENKMQTVAIDYNALYEEYNKIKQEFVRNEAKRNEPDMSLHKLCLENLEESRRSLQDLKRQNDHEITKLKEISDASETELLKVKQENSELKEKFQIAKQHSEKFLKTNKTLQIKLEEALSWKRVFQTSQEAVKVSQQNVWRDMNKMEKLINLKEMELSKTQKKYSTDIKRIKRELKQKEERLQEVLENFRKHLQKCTRDHVALARQHVGDCKCLLTPSDKSDKQS